ncbi:peptidase S24/S26A/S26B/S26C [Kalaharituber pfeilii]|nr:peptidase S24/S26A/S26B/S26C [Kalaharituber pfeilii]
MASILLPPLPSLRSLPSTILLTLPPLIFLTDHVGSLFWVRGRSMSPTLTPFYPPGDDRIPTLPARDCVLTTKWQVRTRPLKRGDIVVFRHPQDPEKGVVKRVVGVQGDVIRPRAPLLRAQGGGSGGGDGMVEVPKGHVWVEGDEGRWSLDSNEYGPVSRFLVYFLLLFLRMGWVRDGEGAGKRKGAVVVKAEERGVLGL